MPSGSHAARRDGRRGSPSTFDCGRCRVRYIRARHPRPTNASVPGLRRPGVAPVLDLFTFHYEKRLRTRHGTSERVGPGRRQTAHTGSRRRSWPRLTAFSRGKIAETGDLPEATTRKRCWPRASGTRRRRSRNSSRAKKRASPRSGKTKNRSSALVLAKPKPR